MATHDAPDDIDRLFACLQSVAPPADLLARALAEASDRQERRRRRVLACAVPCFAGALLTLIVVSFALGRAAADHGTGAILALVVADPRAVLVAPDDLLLAVVENLPLALVAALASLVTALAWGTPVMGGVVGAPRARPSSTGARHG